MLRYSKLRCLAPVVLLVGLLALARVSHVAAEDNPLAVVSRVAFKTPKMYGGIAVQLGSAGGRLAARIGKDGKFTVQVLEADPVKVAKARAFVKSVGLYGPVSVQSFSGRRLPFVSNLINFVVVLDTGQVPAAEVKRVLVPGGFAAIRSDGKWTKLVKPWPDDIDQWSHFLHDATNNAVAEDEVVGPPRSVQWIAPPLWLRSHETPTGIEAPVSAGGRIFYILDEGVIGIVDQRLPSRWALVCRDAFNGKLLWKKKLGAWGWRAWNREKYEGADLTRLRAMRVDVPFESHRRLVVDANRVYVTLAYRAPMSILDAGTGELLTTIPETEDTREILVSDGVAVAYTQHGDSSAAKRRGLPVKVRAAFVAIDTAFEKPSQKKPSARNHSGSNADSGESVSGASIVLWRKTCPAILPMSWAIDQGRIVYVNAKKIGALDLHDGHLLWQVMSKWSRPKSVVCVGGVVVMLGNNYIAALDGVDGRELWQKKIKPVGGFESKDLFVIDGVVWRGMSTVDDQLQPTRKSPDVLDIGWDLRTGAEKNRVFAKNLRSPEHHHRCYRNKVTSRYLISSLEGVEFLDLKGKNHSQNNWLRGACRAGMVPCNGMLYVPTDQCFCEPGAKLLGFAAVTTGKDDGPRAGDQLERLRLVQGKAFDRVEAKAGNPETSWPTFRHDAARHGTTEVTVGPKTRVDWKADLHGPLSAPVVAYGKLFVAMPEAHTVCALDTTDGKLVWRFTADGRVDSPPTVYQGLVLFGARDGWVYAVRATDGELVWRFLAAPVDRRIAYFDQLESAWPVHGSVLIEQGVAYFAAGRSTYLDGGIHVYAVEPATGRLLHQCVLEGPFPDGQQEREVSFYILGANADVLVAEGGFIYMRQKKMTRDLQIVDVPVLSTKGAQDVGLHVFSTASLLDGSWYNRTFWMYSKRWPGFQLANQAPKAGQLLVVDDKNTYAVRVFYRRNVHSPMFFPGKEGYLLFADANTTEPQIVGEPGSKPPVKWLPQSDYSRANRSKQMRTLDSEAFGLDKMIGYTRSERPVWMTWLPVRMRAMVKAGPTLFVAGPPDVLDPKDPYAALDGRRGARLVSLLAEDGRKLEETELGSPPVFDGMICAEGKLFICLEDGVIVCCGGR